MSNLSPSRTMRNSGGSSSFDESFLSREDCLEFSPSPREGFLLERFSERELDLLDRDDLLDFVSDDRILSDDFLIVSSLVPRLDLGTFDSSIRSMILGIGP